MSPEGLTPFDRAVFGSGEVTNGDKHSRKGPDVDGSPLPSDSIFLGATEGERVYWGA